MSTKKFLKTRFESISEPGSAFQVTQQIRNRVPLFGSANRSGTGFRFLGPPTDPEPGSAFWVRQQIRNRVPLFRSLNRFGTGFRFSGHSTDSEPGSAFQVTQQIRNRVPLFRPLNRFGTGFHTYCACLSYPYSNAFFTIIARDFYAGYPCTDHSPLSRFAF